MPVNRLLRCAGVLLLVALSLGLVEAQFHLARGLFGGRPLGQRELATRFLGEYLARQFPGQRVIVLSNPFANRPSQPREVYQFEASGLAGLRRGLGKALAVEEVVFPELRPGALENPRSVPMDRTTTTPLSYLVADDALDRVSRQHPQAAIYVSLIGLPVNIRQTEIWKGANDRKFALLLPDMRVVGDIAAVRRAVEDGKVAAMVLRKPGAPPEDVPLGRDSQAEFDRRFLLITPANLDRCLQAYPRLFSAP